MISKSVVIFTLDLKRVIYEVFNHVIQGDLRQEDAIPLLSDVTVRIHLFFDYSFDLLLPILSWIYAQAYFD